MAPGLTRRREPPFQQRPWCRSLLRIIGLLGLAACIGCTADRVLLFPPLCQPLSAGDSAYASAASHHGTGGWTEVASSDVSPQHFRWESRDQRVADVTARGLIRARAPGVTWLVVTTDRLRDSARVAVRPPVPVAVALRPPPPYVLGVGDTVRLRIDVQRAPVAHGWTEQTWAEQLACAPHLGTHATGAFTVERGFPDTAVWQLVARASGRGDLTWSAHGRSGVVPVTVVGARGP